MENVVMKVRNILPQNMNEEVIGKNAIMITKAMISMMKQMVHLTKKAREFQKVQVLLKKKGHLVVNPLLIIQPMTILKQTNRNRHKQKKKKRLFKLTKKITIHTRTARHEICSPDKKYTMFSFMMKKLLF